MSEHLPEHVDVAVVGAGVIGLATALELLQRGRQVVVLERAAAGAGASSVAAGMLAPTSEADLEERQLIDFALDSLRRYPAFVARVTELSGQDCGYRDEGTVWVARKRDDEGDLDHLLRMQREKGLSSRRLTAQEVLAAEPYLSGRVLSGLLVEGDHQVDPRLLVSALAASVTRLGGRIVTGCQVRSIEPVTAGTGGTCAVVGELAGEGFELPCRVALLAAGAWSSTGIRSAVSEMPLPVRPVKGQIVRVRGPRLIEHVVRVPEVYLVPRRDGELLIGGTMEEKGFDAAPTAGAVMDLLRFAWEVLPGIAELQVSELSVGFRPAVRDHLPVLGRVGPEGVYAAIGHYRNGVLLAPATAHYLAEMIVEDRCPAALAPFGAARFAPPPPPGAPGQLM